MCGLGVLILTYGCFPKVTTGIGLLLELSHLKTTCYGAGTVAWIASPPHATAVPHMDICSYPGCSIL